MTIRKAETADLGRLDQCAREFYSSSKFLRGFDLERFTAFWMGLIQSGTGVVFLLIDGNEVAGTIGGVIYPEPYSGELVATEFFWFVRPELRGGGVKLYRAFEAWARDRGASQLRMVHLLDSMPEKLERAYTHLGFEPAEIHYTKEL